MSTDIMPPIKENQMENAMESGSIFASQCFVTLLISRIWDYCYLSWAACDRTTVGTMIARREVVMIVTLVKIACEVQRFTFEQ